MLDAATLAIAWIVDFTVTPALGGPSGARCFANDERCVMSE